MSSPVCLDQPCTPARFGWAELLDVPLPSAALRLLRPSASLLVAPPLRRLGPLPLPLLLPPLLSLLLAAAAAALREPRLVVVSL